MVDLFLYLYLASAEPKGIQEYVFLDKHGPFENRQECELAKPFAIQRAYIDVVAQPDKSWIGGICRARAI